MIIYTINSFINDEAQFVPVHTETLVANSGNTAYSVETIMSILEYVKYMTYFLIMIFDIFILMFAFFIKRTQKHW